MARTFLINTHFGKEYLFMKHTLIQRLAALGMSLTLALGLTGCNTASLPDDLELGNTLVVYFSATGNTENAARAIAEQLDADLFEITPADPYTSADLNWNDPESRVSVEHAQKEAGTLQPVSLANATPDNWSSYDTVFIGYPIWWFEAAWPVESFVRANDFTGKTVIPFCTSASSGIGNSGELLAQAAGTGTWLDGQRFSSGVSESDIRSWLAALEG